MVPFPTLEESTKIAAPKSIPAVRIASIDIVRALTMLLMIFVNDLGSLRGIPDWLEHVKRGVDGIGLADIVFPGFLFIVGLSLPFAIDNRRKKGDTTWQLVQHVLARTIALLVMGVFFVNGENFNSAATGMPGYLWDPLCCLSFILIWNLYPKNANKTYVNIAKAAGIVTLIILAFVYRGGEHGDHTSRFSPQWWGILGLIGWAYLAGGLITVFAKNNFWVILGGWAFFCILSMVYKADLIPQNGIASYIPNAIYGGTLAGLTMGGVLTSMIFKHFRKRNDNKNMTLVFLGFSVILIVLSLVTRPYWKLAKLGATPAWLFLCSAFTLLAFTAVYWLADVYKKANWFNIIKPAGTDTLLCYLMPYFVYSIFQATHFHLPGVLITGGIGLLKSFLLALLCIFIAGRLNKAGIRLKL
jgi:heparan-alpha-glucosaminide N-acetyltransferase